MFENVAVKLDTLEAVHVHAHAYIQNSTGVCQKETPDISIKLKYGV